MKKLSTFENFNLSEPLFKAIQKLGFTEPTEIQEKSIPYVVEGKDVLGESATGSGKTLAFGCAIVEYVEPGKGIQALVLTPTRELADQARLFLSKISHFKSLNVISVYGGVSISPQIHELRKADVVVATPGRFLDHVERNTVNTSRIKILVIDEADRMLDMGFINDVERIIKTCPKQRQTLLFTATFPDEVKRLANRYMTNPIEVSAKKHVDPNKLKQVYYDVSKKLKLSLLVHLLQHEISGLVMVFCNTRRTTDFVVKNLKSNKISAIAIHGGLSQNKRTKTLDMFDKAKTQVLVCTDVAARGLHIDNVSHVYNYDLPVSPKDYVHRIGRTARAGESGQVINLLCEYDHENYSRILREYREFSIKKEEMPEVKTVFAMKVDEHKGHPGREMPNKFRRHTQRSGRSSGERGNDEGRKPWFGRDSRGSRFSRR